MNAKEFLRLYVDSIGIRTSVNKLIKNDCIMQKLGYYEDCRRVDRIEVLTDMKSHLNKVLNRIDSLDVIGIFKILPFKWVNCAYNKLDNLIDHYNSQGECVLNGEIMEEALS